MANAKTVESAKKANLKAWEARTAEAWLAAAKAWTKAGDKVAARMCREQANLDYLRGAR